VFTHGGEGILSEILRYFSDKNKRYLGPPWLGGEQGCQRFASGATRKADLTMSVPRKASNALSSSATSFGSAGEDCQLLTGHGAPRHQRAARAWRAAQDRSGRAQYALWVDRNVDAGSPRSQHDQRVNQWRRCRRGGASLNLLARDIEDRERVLPVYWLAADHNSRPPQRMR
jgi:hypothetical protein